MSTKKRPSHPLAYHCQGYLSDIGAYLSGMSKAALIDVVCDALDLQDAKDLDAARRFIDPRLTIRGDRQPMAEVKAERKYREGGL